MSSDSHPRRLFKVPVVVCVRLILGFAVCAAGVHATSALSGVADKVAEARLMQFVNVRDFGAVGDGKTDDTGAIRAAIASLPAFSRRNPFIIKPIFFPNGVYLISGTLERKIDGQFAPGLAFFGESENGVSLRLKDNAWGFGDPGHPKPLLFFASGLLHGAPNAGGRDYHGLGEGNDAYQNYVQGMTVDTGRNNPGAIGIDYLASNIGAIRSVHVISRDGKGRIGISLTRKWIGPALLRDVSIKGFGIGIDVANTEYSIVLDGIHVVGSREFGIRNTSNSVSFSGVRISAASGVGIANLTAQALLVGRDAQIGGKTTSSVANQGYMNLVDVFGLSAVHRRGATEEGDRLDGVFGPSGRIGNPAWTLPVKSAPDVPQYGIADWANVTRYGAIADPHRDSTAAIQAAMNSGRPVICFPNGIYRVTAPITVPRSVHRIEGSFSTVFLDFRAQRGRLAEFGQDMRQAGFVIGKRETSLFVNRIVIRNDINTASNFARIAFLYSGKGALVLADDVVGEMVAIKRMPSGGEVWAENLVGGKFSFQGRAGVWIRQLNTEGRGVRIRNRGAHLWVLGSKTEGNMTLLDNSDGAVSELFGGLVYMVHFDGHKVPYLRNTDGIVTAAFAEESFLPDAVYQTFLESDNGGKKTQIRAGELPWRHHSARMVPQISTDNRFPFR